MNQPKTQPSKPSAGTMRAATAIDEFCITTDLNDVSAIMGIAEIIDRETKAPEMYWLAERIIDAADSPDSEIVCGTFEWDQIVSEARRIKAAIDGV